MDTMKAAVFYGKHDVRVELRPMPVPGDDEVLIKVMACGVCGTDVHIFEGDKGAADCTPPTILGHEFSGVIAQVGKGVTGLSVGDRVCVDPNNTCNCCYYCREGLPHYCQRMIGYGTTTDGGFAQYCKVHYKQAYRFHDGLSFEQAAMAEPISCCLHGIDLSDVRSGSTVLVIGAGMIGLIMLQLARLNGAARVIVLEPVAEKRDMAARLGASLCVDPVREDVKEALRAHGVQRVETVIECAGLPRTIEQALDLVGNKGTVMMFGLTKPDDQISVKPFSIFQKETTIRASFINPCTIGRGVELLGAGRLDVSSMLQAPVPLEGLIAALSDPAARAKGKFIVNPWLEGK